MDYHIKALIIIIVITILLIIIFAIIYWRIQESQEDDGNNNKGFSNAIYTSVTIQTMVGMDNEPKLTSLRWLYSLQALLSYAIMIGLIYVILKNALKPK